MKKKIPKNECPECGSTLLHQDNSKTIEQLRQKIGELESEKSKPGQR